MTNAKPQTAAFFDFDGTIVDSTIVHYYVYLRTRGMPKPLIPAWKASYLACCLGYLLLDAIDRSLFNRVFYWSYRRFPTDWLDNAVEDLYTTFMQPRLFPQALDELRQHREAGRPVILVTGTTQTLLNPFIDAHTIDAAICPDFQRADNRLTGLLDRPPLAGDQKAKCMQRFAKRHNIDLTASYAYGDSIADRAMLETVGHPYAVNPDNQLAHLAKTNNWPVCTWSKANHSATEADHART